MLYMEFINYIPKFLKKRVFFLIPLLSLSGILEVASLALLIPLISLVLEPSTEIISLEWLGITNYSETEKIMKNDV
mgnify:CR=1 FL=1